MEKNQFLQNKPMTPPSTWVQRSCNLTMENSSYCKFTKFNQTLNHLIILIIHNIPNYNIADL